MTWQTQYDRWATGGRYSSERLLITCANCEEQTRVLAENEYGTTSWTPDECDSCHESFADDVKWTEDEPA